jgi:hypothetical protein
MNWIVDTAAEELLNKLGIPFTFRTHIPIKDFRVEESKNTNARSGNPIDEAHVLDMAQAMRDGASFPALVCTKSLLVLAGNNRVASADLADIGYVDAYIIDQATPKTLRVEFGRRDNQRHGLKNTDDERIEHCVDLYERNPKRQTLKSLSDELLGRNDKLYGKLVVAWEARVVKKQLTAEGVDVIDTKKEVLYRMHPIVGQRSLLVTVGRLAVKYKLNGSMIEEMVKAISGLNTEHEKKAYAKEYSMAHGPKAKIKMQDATKFKRKLRMLLSFLEGGTRAGDNKGVPVTTLAEIGLGNDKELENDINAVVVKLKTVLKKAKK